MAAISSAGRTTVSFENEFVISASLDLVSLLSFSVYPTSSPPRYFPGQCVEVIFILFSDAPRHPALRNPVIFINIA